MDFQNKIWIVVVATVLLVSIAACRKEIVHVPGVTDSSVEDTSGTGSNGTWSKVTNESGLDLMSIEAFNGEIYIGGDFELIDDSLESFAKLNSQGQVVQAAQGNWYFGGVSDLEIINNSLYACGAFSYFNLDQLISAYSFFKMNNSGIISEVEITTTSFDNIRDIQEFNGGIVVSGYFAPDSDNLFVSENVDFLTNEVPQGLSNLVAHVYQTIEFNGELYAVGDELLLQKWNGSSWIDIIYNDPYWQDEVFSAEVYNSELYILGNFNNGIVVKKMTSAGVWTNESSVTAAGLVTSFDNLKVIDDKLYLLGGGFLMDDVQTSKVLSFDGSVWSNVGNMTTDARDITKLNNKLYLATSSGVYEIDQ